MDFKKEFQDFKLLLKSIPATTMVFFVVSIICMNIFAQKELFNVKYLALDCGFTLSWIAFLCGDMITRRFGAKAAIEMSIFVEVVNLLFSAVFFLLCLIPTNWGEFYSTGNQAVNVSINNTLGGTWYVVLGSTTAFVVSAIINALINENIGKKLEDRGFKNYAIRSFVSTFIGQFADNLIFAYIVSIHFFGWTHLQAWVCALTGAIFELLCEVAFSGLGYRTSQRWKDEKVGELYLNAIVEYSDK